MAIKWRATVRPIIIVQTPAAIDQIWSSQWVVWDVMYGGADNSLSRPGRKQARKHVRDARDFNNIETRAVIIFFFFLQGKAPKDIPAILTEINLFPSWSD